MSIQDLLKNLIFWWVFWGGLLWVWIWVSKAMDDERIPLSEHKGWKIFFILVAIAGLVANIRALVHWAFPNDGYSLATSCVTG